MRRALVLGAEHEMGALLCQSLERFNWHITATVADPSQPISLSANMTLAELAPQDNALLNDLIAKTDTVFLHLPDPIEGGQVFFSLDNILKQAAQYRRNLVITTNIYDTRQPLFSSLAFWRKKKPVAYVLPKKISAKLEMAANAGANIKVLCYGHNLNFSRAHSYLGILVKETHHKFILQSPSAYSTNHYWTYLPDLAENLVRQLSAESKCSPPLSVNYYPGHLASIKDIARGLALSTGKPVTVTPLHWTVIEAISVFSPLFRRFINMRSLWQQGGQLPLRPSDWQQTKLQHTPLELALQRIWHQLRQSSG
ncbi:hypothetical protein RJ45_20625 [Photobacterium gaetbulicola]|uniref:NAD-dependent epimerase/dehydratase domain-containing protein n=1 Tax=Photobacterium gaetbulicola TaxID=1295392 RepID=A0A0B9GYW7_9GAMM|nr:hypothetical protein [Photobacterium gaetbulicola]KHT61842.1 hypothetical protein RJ45_20625 [Photobacterium gaetbulicola]